MQDASFHLHSKLQIIAIAAILPTLISCGGQEPTTTGYRTQSLATADAGSMSFSGPRNSYTVTASGASYIVTDSSGSVTIPANVQSLVFNDVSVNLGIGAKSLTISADDLTSLIELYVAYFNRVPDANGLAYWIDQFKGGQSLDQIGRSFYVAALQYPALTGYSETMGNVDFVKLIYKNALSRSSPDQAGLDYWTKSLDQGTQTRGSLVKAMLAAAHTYKGDSVWGWVADVLDNKDSVAHYAAVEQGLTYNSDVDSISKGIAIAAAVTATDTTAAVNIVNVNDRGFSLTLTTLKSYTVGGTITGLTTDGLVLSNGNESLHVAAGSTSFAFNTKFLSGDTYAVKVQGQPGESLSCSVGGDYAGRIANADLRAVTVSCSSIPNDTGATGFSLGGTINGLSSGGLVLANGSDTVQLAANSTAFTFGSKVARGSTYSVSINSRPLGFQVCTVEGSFPQTMPTANVRSVVVDCGNEPAMVKTQAGGYADFADGPWNQAFFYNPMAIAVDTAGNSYIADTYNWRIRQVDTRGFVTTLAGTGKSKVVDGWGGSFSAPLGIALDKDGNVYVTDGGNGAYLIRKITPAGIISTIAGSGLRGAANGVGTSASFAFDLFRPAGIAVDTAGNIYVGDTLNNLLRKIAPNGTVSTLAGGGSAGYADGTGAAASFNAISGLAVDGAGNIYVADSNNHVIRKVTPAGAVSTLAGSGTRGYADGPSTSASFDTPEGVTVDRVGNVYVADTNNNRIRMIAPSGVVSTLAGNGVTGGADGVGVAATFFLPMGVAADSKGGLRVLENGGSRVRWIYPKSLY